MSRCELWRGQWLSGLRTDAKCAPRALPYGCGRAPYRISSCKSPGGYVLFDCSSPWLAIGHYKGTLYLDGRAGEAVHALAAERVGAGGFPLGGARRVAQIAALARASGVHVFEYDFEDRDARRAIPEAVEAARVLVAAVAYLLGARLPGLTEGCDVCPARSAFCAWAPGCCLPDVRGRASDRVFDAERAA